MSLLIYHIRYRLPILWATARLSLGTTSTTAPRHCLILGKSHFPPTPPAPSQNGKMAWHPHIGLFLPAAALRLCPSTLPILLVISYKFHFSPTHLRLSKMARWLGTPQSILGCCCPSRPSGPSTLHIKLVISYRRSVYNPHLPLIPLPSLYFVSFAALAFSSPWL